MSTFREKLILLCPDSFVAVKSMKRKITDHLPEHTSFRFLMDTIFSSIEPLLDRPEIH